MIQEAKGQEYGVGSGGLGAVYAPESKVIDIMEKTNDDILDYAKIRQAQQAQAAAQAQALRAAFDVSEGEAMPSHLPGIRDAISQLKDNFAKGFSMYGNNLNSPEAQKYFNNLRFEKNQIEQAVKTSQGIYHAARAGTEKFNPKTDSPDSLNNIKAALNSTFADLVSGKVPTDFSSIPLKESLNDFLDGYFKSYNEKMTTKESLGRKNGEIISYSTTYNIDPAKIDEHVDAVYDSDRNGREVANEAFQLLPEDKKLAYIDARVKNGTSPEVAKYEAAKDFLKDRMKLKLIQSKKQEHKAFDDVEIEGRKAAQKGAAFVDLVSLTAKGDKSIMKVMREYNPADPTKFADVYGTTMFNNFTLPPERISVPQVDDAGKATGKSTTIEVENSPTIVFQDPGTEKLVMKTTASQAKFTKGLATSPYIYFENAKQFMNFMENSPEVKASWGTPDQHNKYIDVMGASLGADNFDADKIVNWRKEDEEARQQKAAQKIKTVPLNKKVEAFGTIPNQQQGKTTTKKKISGF